MKAKIMNTKDMNVKYVNANKKAYIRLTGNNGAALVFMVLLMVEIVVIFWGIYACAQAAATYGMAADAAGLAQNAVMAGYNHSIKDAYGMICYTQSDTELSAQAQHFAEESMPVDSDIRVKAGYTGTSLADDSQFAVQIDKYMSKWDKTCGHVTQSQLGTLKGVVDKASDIRKKLESDMNKIRNLPPGNHESISGSAVSEDEMKQAMQEAEKRSQAADAREKMIGSVDPDNAELRFEAATLDYRGKHDIIPAPECRIDSERDADKNVRTAADMLKSVEEYFDTLDETVVSMTSVDTSYHLALYAVNNFSAFRYYGSTALTGRSFVDGDMPSVSQWGENEFMLNGASDDITNCKVVKRMIFAVLFSEYMAGSYDTLMNDEDISGYAAILSGGNAAYMQLIMDELIVGISANLAYEALVKIYSADTSKYSASSTEAYTERYSGSPLGGNIGVISSVTLTDYPAYIELFDLLETERNMGGFIKRMRYLMDTNAAHASGGDAAQFRCANAYFSPQISGATVEISMMGVSFKAKVR